MIDVFLNYLPSTSSRVFAQLDQLHLWILASEGRNSRIKCHSLVFHDFFLGAALEQVVLKPEKPPRHSCGSWKTCLPVTSGRSPYHRTLQSRSVALSRCPDASYILAAWMLRSMARMGK